MQDRPTAGELLEAIADFLTTDVEPHVPDWLRFQLRVARNSLTIVRRELEHEDEYLLEELRGLNKLLGDAPHPDSPATLRLAVLARNDELCRRISAGDFDQPEARQGLLEHLRTVVDNKLRVSNPRYVV
jgi:Domain of unknown function (DUF6285)